MAQLEKQPQMTTRRALHLPYPILRITITALIALSLIYTTHTIFLPCPPPPYSPADRIDYTLPTRPNPLPTSHSPPFDLVLPPPPPNGIPPESRIGKISILFNGKDPTLVRALQTHEAHNRRFGYPLLLLRHGLLDGGTLDGIWNKSAYVLAALLEEMRKPEVERLQWLFWHDADTILLSPLIPLTLFLPPPSHPHIHLLLTADPHGLNNGVFFLRVHAWSISLLTAVLAHPTYRPSTPLPYRDQSALGLLLQNGSVTAYGAHFLAVPQRWFNAYAGELEGDESDGGGRPVLGGNGGGVGEGPGGGENGGEVTGEDEAAVGRAGEKVKEAVVGGEIPAVVREALGELEQVAHPYRILAQQDQKALTKDAHAAVVEAERIMLSNTTAQPQLRQTLQRMLERLRELLAREPNNMEGLKEGMDDLLGETRDFGAKAQST
ncbi:hypothetical protein MMC27_007959 [Xylographa pallens]|nr:hypothetical protein [Xylographa pallens]